MSYSTGTASDQDDLMTKLRTFLTANGWTSDQFDTVNNFLALHRGTCYVQFYWDAVANIAVFQSTSHDGSNPGNNPDDSGNTAQTSGTITLGHRANILTNSTVTYHFFESDTYAYVAIEISAGVWRFIGFGECVKYGSWTGGAFSFATYFSQVTPSHDHPNIDAHSFIADVGHNVSNAAQAGYLQCQGLPGQAAAGRWGVFCQGSNGVADTGDDTAGEDRVVIHGGSRGGPYASALAWIPKSASQGFAPLIPIPVWYLRTDTSPFHYHPLGYLPDIRQVNIKFFNDAEEVTIGSDTWIVFPMASKTDTLGATTDNSGYAGYAIKKVTT